MEKPKILVIDDDPDFAEGLKIFLEANDYEAHIAENGTNGFKLIREIHPDLIILDVMMDTITEGFQVSYQLRSQDPSSEFRKFSKTPIIMLTGISKKMHMKLSKKKDDEYLPVDEFVEKPIRFEALLEKVKKLLKK